MCALPTATVASTTGPTRFQSVDPAHTALLVTDMQEGLTAQARPAGDALAARIATAERASRRAGVMVGFAKTEFAPGYPEVSRGHRQRLGLGRSEALACGEAVSAANAQVYPAIRPPAKKVNLERDNIRAALVNAIDAGDAPLAVQLVANHPHRQSANANPIGEVFSVPAPRVLDLPCAAEQPDYPRVLIVAAYHARDSGDDDKVDALCRRALEAERRLSSPIHGPPIEMDVCTLQAEAALSTGAFADAVTAYTRAAELAGVRGYSGPAAIYLAYCVNAMLLASIHRRAWVTGVGFH